MANTENKTMCMSNLNPNAKFTKHVFISGVPLVAFVDFGSEVTLIRESSASQLDFIHNGVPSTMKVSETRFFSL